MAQHSTLTSTIRVAPELWSCNMLPEGVLERWLRPDGSEVQAGDPVATVRIEDSLHELAAPAGGRLRTDLKINSIIEPGMVIGSVVGCCG